MSHDKRKRWIGTRMDKMDVYERSPSSASYWSCDTCGNSIGGESDGKYFAVTGYVGAYHIYWLVCATCVAELKAIRADWEKVLENRPPREPINVLRYYIVNAEPPDLRKSFMHSYYDCAACGERTGGYNMETYVVHYKHGNTRALCPSCAELYEKIKKDYFVSKLRKEYHAEMKKFRQRLKIARGGRND